MKKFINLFILSILITVTFSQCTPIQPTVDVPEPTENQASPTQISHSIVITSLEDSGPGTLRQALLDAKDNDLIEFEPEIFPADTPGRIMVDSELPFIEINNLILDASNAGVVIDGSQITEGWVAGLQIVSGNDNTIRGLQISNFPGPGIAISGNSTNNVIGGSRKIGSGPYGQGNHFTSNARGVDLSTQGTSLNIIVGNLIGTDSIIMDGYGNQAGIWVSEGAHDNRIGPDNLIAYNTGPGIVVEGPDTLANTITQNDIHDNFENDIELRSGGNIDLPAPILQDFNLSLGTLAGTTCANCKVEIFSSCYESVVTADENGVFSYDKGLPFSGNQLFTTTTDSTGNTSGFSSPTTGRFSSSVSPTLIFYNGTILTMDADRSIGSSIAIEGQTIQAVGEDEAILNLAGKDTQLIDLGGKVLMPGFIDTHNHLMEVHEKNFEEEQELILQNGVTTIGVLYAMQEWIDILGAYDQETGLKNRVNLYLNYNNSCGEIYGDWYIQYPPTQSKSEMLRIAGVKVYSDGGACNAPAVSYTYEDGGQGDLYFTQAEMNQLVREINDHGYQAAIHALGDRAAEQVLAAIEAANNENTIDMRNRIEHNTLIRDDMLGLHDQSDAVAIIFGHYPTCYFLGLNEKAQSTTPEDMKGIEWRWKDLIETNPNTVFAWHTDIATVYGPKAFGIFSLNPFVNLNGYVTRQEHNADGSICEPEDWMLKNTITVEQALPIMTINGAYALNMDDVIGSLEPGKFADLIIISDNPLTIKPEELYDIDVLMTMVGGKDEFCAEGSESLCP